MVWSKLSDFNLINETPHLNYRLWSQFKTDLKELCVKRISLVIIMKRLSNLPLWRFLTTSLVGLSVVVYIFKETFFIVISCFGMGLILLKFCQVLHRVLYVALLKLSSIILHLCYQNSPHWLAFIITTKMLLNWYLNCMWKLPDTFWAILIRLVFFCHYLLEC